MNSKYIPGTKQKHTANQHGALPHPKEVDSLLDIMKDGNEYQSIVSYLPKRGEIVSDIQRAIRDLQTVRQRPCVCYVANVIQQIDGTGIDYNDDLPFNEMINSVPPGTRDIDVFMVTPGGLGQQVSQFVNSLRQRFDSVEFLLPHMCMSAGTLWVLSGDRIWMDRRAFIGPIDPQVRTKNGGMVPAQSVLTLLNKIREEGDIAIRDKKNPPWHYIRMIDVMDPKEVGFAISASQYSIKMATDFLLTYKFKHWATHGKTGTPVTPDEKRQRSAWIAQKLCSNEYWKSHGHGITRETANTDLKLKIDQPEQVKGLERAIRRLWALFYFTFEKTLINKIFIADNYVLVRQSQKGKIDTL